MQIAQRLKEWNHLPAAWRERLGYVLDCLRIVVGVILVMKAITFIGDKAYLQSMFAASDDLWFIPAIVSHYVILAHLAGGLCLIVGLLSRPAALIQIPVLLGAIFYVQLPRFLSAHEPQQLEYAIMMLLLLVVILVHGGGKLSVDYLVWGRDKEESRADS